MDDDREGGRDERTERRARVSRVMTGQRVAFVRRFRERVKRDFGVDLGAARKEEKTSLVLDRDVSPNATRYRPDRVVVGGNARVAAHLGSGAPAAAGPGSGARAREIAARRRRRERGRCELRAAGREEEGGRRADGPSWVRGKKPLGRTTACRPTMCTAWSTSIFAGTSAATGMVRTTARPASRSILRRTAGCTVIGCVARKPRLANAFSRRARSTDTARWFSAHHDVRLFTPPHGT
jgi:hypothetical protein